MKINNILVFGFVALISLQTQAQSCKDSFNPSKLKFSGRSNLEAVIEALKVQDRRGLTQRGSIDEAAPGSKRGLLSTSDSTFVLNAIAESVGQSRSKVPLKGLEDKIAELGIDYRAINADYLKSAIVKGRLNGYPLITFLATLENAIIKSNYVPGKNDAQLKEWRETLIHPIQREFATAAVDHILERGPEFQDVSMNGRIGGDIFYNLINEVHIQKQILSNYTFDYRQLIDLRTVLNVVRTSHLQEFLTKDWRIGKEFSKAISVGLPGVSSDAIARFSQQGLRDGEIGIDRLFLLAGPQIKSEVLRALAIKLSAEGQLNISIQEAQSL